MHRIKSLGRTPASRLLRSRLRPSPDGHCLREDTSRIELDNPAVRHHHWDHVPVLHPGNPFVRKVLDKRSSFLHENLKHSLRRAVPLVLNRLEHCWAPIAKVPGLGSRRSHSDSPGEACGSRSAEKCNQSEFKTAKDNTSPDTIATF